MTAELAAIEFANVAFYQAFAAADSEAMAQAWAESAPVACTHPGAAPIFGRDRVLASWQSIFAGMAQFPIRHELIRVELFNGVGVAHCAEILESATLAATNLFVKEGRVWRIAHHHAGPASFETIQWRPSAGETVN